MYISLVIPAHNEQERLAETLCAYGQAFSERFEGRFEIIVVANMCTDGTVQVAREAALAMPAICVIDIRQHVGKGGAIIAGLQHARGDYVLFADADGSTAPETLFDLIDGLASYDVVIGSRRLARSQILVHQPALRQLFSLLFALAVRLLFGLPYRDTQCGAKGMRREAARRLAGAMTEMHWVFDVDLLLTSRALGLRVGECPVVWSHREGSKLKVGAASQQVAAALWRLWWAEWRRDGARAGRAQTDGDGHQRPLRILALNWRCLKHPQAGGSEVNLFEQARRWVGEGHEVTVFCADPGRAYVAAPVELVDGVEVRHQGGRFSVYFFAALYLLRHGHRYDRVLDIANGIPFFAPLFTQTPTTLLVHHVHGQQWFEEFPAPVAVIGRFVEEEVVPLIYRNKPVVAVSASTQEALADLGFADEQLHTVYNGVFHPETPLSAINSCRVTFIGRLKQYKRVDRLVQMIDRLRAAIPDIHLDIVGTGDGQARIEALIERHDLHGHVTLHGHVDEERKQAILRQTTVFATASMHEGWGISVLEANAYGCPAVAYNVPGLSAAIRHGETGLLADSDEEFEQALALLLRNGAVRAAMGRAARQWASRFSWAHTARATLRILRSSAGWRASKTRPAQEDAWAQAFRPELPVAVGDVHEREVGGWQG